MGRAKRKKKRTHVEQDESALPRVPRTFVMERGRVGNLLNQLVLDLRQVMEPHTASKLKVHRKNVLKDFVQVAGPLGVTHFLILSRTEEFINLRVCRLPRGPTITFHIKSFSLAREVISCLRKPVSSPTQYLTPPLLILNNFTTEDKLTKLMATMFQNMFPSINIQTVKLADTRRCVLFHYDHSKKTIEFRHYNIRLTPLGMTRGVKKLARSQVPKLGHYDDISDYVLGGNVSESEGEELAGEGEVTLSEDLPGRGNIKSEQSAIRLSELGPRMSLQLVKIESGLCGGEVLHHEFIRKSRREVRDLRKRVVERKRLKERRRKQQEANVLRKKEEKEQHRQRCLAGQGAAKEDEDVSSDDDVEWYKQEVGEEPDPDTFVPGKLPRKRKAQYQRKFPPTAKRHRPNQAHPSSTHSTYNRNQTTNAHPTNKRPSTHPTAKRYSTTSTRPTAKRYSTTSTHPTAKRYSTTSTRPSPTVAKRLKRVQQKQPRTGRQRPRNSEQREPLVKFARRRGQRPKTTPHSKIKKRSAGQVFRKRAKAS